MFINVLIVPTLKIGAPFWDYGTIQGARLIVIYETYILIVKALFHYSIKQFNRGNVG